MWPALQVSAPVDITRAFIEMCRPDLRKMCSPAVWDFILLKHMITSILNGDFDYEILDLIEETALSIMQTADCAIGSEAAKWYGAWYIPAVMILRHISAINDAAALISPASSMCCLCPAHVDIPGYIALVKRRTLCRCHPVDPQRITHSLHLRFYLRTSMRSTLPPQYGRYLCKYPGLKRAAADLAGKVTPASLWSFHRQKIAVRRRTFRPLFCLLSAVNGPSGHCL